MSLTLQSQENLHVRQGTVTELVVEDGQVRGVKPKSGVIIPGERVILATGTFLGGMIVIGDAQLSRRTRRGA